MYTNYPPMIGNDLREKDLMEDYFDFMKDITSEEIEDREEFLKEENEAMLFEEIVWRYYD